MNDRLLGKVAARLAQVAANYLLREFEKNSYAVLGMPFAPHDLVGREESDAQPEWLARARARVAALESRLARARRPA